jgi:hypothetical protein
MIPSLRIGCAPDIPVQRLQEFIGGLYLLGASWQPEVVHCRASDQLGALRCGGLDVGLMHARGEEPGIETEPMFLGEFMAAFFSLAHPLTRRDTIAPSDLADQTVVVCPRIADPTFHLFLGRMSANAGWRFGGLRETLGAHPRDALFAVADGVDVTLGPVSMPHTVGEMGPIVATRILDPPQRMPDTVVAYPTDPKEELQEAIALARAVARDSYEAVSESS